jgi:hypothetical protein
MEQINSLLTQTGNIEAGDKTEYLKNLAKNKIESHYEDLNQKLSSAMGMQDVGGLMVTAPQTIRTGYTGINNVKNFISNRFKKPTNENAEAVENKNPKDQLEGNENSNQGHSNNAANETTEGDTELSDITDTAVDTAIDTATDTAATTAASVTGGLTFGAVSEGFLNPIMDVAAIGSGIGLLVSGIVKKAKEVKREKTEEIQEKASQLDPRNIAKVGQTTAASTLDTAQKIGMSATTEF